MSGAARCSRRRACRFAGAATENLNYRVYARLLRQDASDSPAGGSREDDWHRIGGGFRLDWTPSTQDTVTFQGDIFDGREDQAGPAHEDIAGHDLVLRWNRDFSADEQVQVQAFYDRFRRSSAPDNGSFYADTYDIDAQHSFSWGRSTRSCGAAAGASSITISTALPASSSSRASRSLFLGNVFVQDTFALTDAVGVTAGLKAEHDPYVGFSLLPDLRLAIKPSASTLAVGGSLPRGALADPVRRGRPGKGRDHRLAQRKSRIPNGKAHGLRAWCPGAAAVRPLLLGHRVLPSLR